MTYERVVPRDLFNEASLLKCIGRVWINLDQRGLSDAIEHDGAAFDVEQSQDDGSLYCANVTLWVAGRHIHLWRPLNAREPWPLFARLPMDDDGLDYDDIPVFSANGDFSPEMNDFLLHISDAEI